MSTLPRALVWLSSIALLVSLAGCGADDEGPISNPIEQGKGGTGSQSHAGKDSAGSGGKGSNGTAGKGEAGSSAAGSSGGGAGTGAGGSSAAGSGQAGASGAGAGGTDAGTDGGVDASIPSIDACEMNSDCGFGEIDHEILSPSDCVCLFGCAYLPLNQTTLMRRAAQYQQHCDANVDGEGNPCPIDDCVPLPNPVCKDNVCGGQEGPPES